MARGTTGGLLILLLAAWPAATQPGSGYVGSQTCAGCHSKLYQDYVRTAMGRSMSPAATGAPHLNRPVTVHDAKLDRYFQVFKESGVLYQSEWQQEGDREVFRSTHKLEYTVGSGLNGLSFVVRRRQHLFQAPLSYYARTRSWALSPGYAFADYGFSRPIHAACISCHSARAQAVPQRDGEYGEPSFLELAIGCENCHGPGEDHVVRRGKIINPARLPVRLAEDICMSCHQGGDTRVLQPGKQYLDFRPGAPLEFTLAIFKLPRASGASETDLLEHHEAMKLSRCYQASDAKLSCLTCHNPHGKPKSAEAAKYYRSRCLTCHVDSSCRLPRGKRNQASDDCAGCHMPKREIKEISHSALTNHRIVQRPGLTPRQTRFPDPALPGLVFLNSLDASSTARLPLLTRLAAYGELMAKEPKLLPYYLSTLERLRVDTPEEPLVLAALGRKALQEGDTAAVDLLERSVQKGSEAATTFFDLAEALSRSGRPERALEILDHGIRLHPFSKELRKSRILRLITIKQYDTARLSMQQYLEIFPEDSFLRELLRKVSQNAP